MLTPNTNGTIASSLSRKATLVSVNVSIWTARRLDKKVTDEVNQAHNAAADAGRYNKLLLPAEHLKELTGLVSAARELHYKYTRAWGDDGLRILPNVLYTEFTNQFRVIKQKYDDAADAFCREYPAYVEAAKGRLNGLYNAADYPHASEIRAKFQLGLSWSTVPDAADFRSEALDEDTVNDIRKEIEASVREQERQTASDTYRQIGEIVGHMATKLKEFGDYDPAKKDKKTGKVKKVYFKDSLVDNVRELAKLLPAFNLNDDPKLAKIAERIETELTIEDAQALRDNDGARAAVQKSAEEIFDAVSAFMA